MTKFDWRATAGNMRPQDFELLVREYAVRQCRRVQAEMSTAGMSAKDIDLHLTVKVDRDGQMEYAGWKMSMGWGENETKGEVLDGVADEQVRRERWQRAAVLRQIEG